ncbi:MAG TPA: HD domain-containing protein [Tepidisphaeraceae bacterium]|nr:HD domain-containing protein [Tepidisphaeraceae bacterium]
MRADRREGSLCLKSHALAKWAAGHLGSIEHERRVAAIASRLFQLIHRLHDLAGEDLRLLRMAALVHDVGRAIDDQTHPQQGAAMLQRDADLPLSGGERRALAYLTRWHRGRVPEVGRDGILRRKDDVARLRLILALLRAADALDGRQLESPRMTMSLRGRRLCITCQLNHDSAKARRVYGRKKKFRLLEELLGCRVEVELAVARPMRRVA